jgi:hypothetical protein
LGGLLAIRAAQFQPVAIRMAAVTIDFLMQEEFLSADEQLAYRSAWEFLNSGNHSGLSSEDEGPAIRSLGPDLQFK